jgi:hypothetical protein
MPSADRPKETGVSLVPVEHKRGLAIAGEPRPGRTSAQARHRIAFRPRDQEHGAEALPRKRVHERLQPDGERKGLVGLLAAERNEILLCGVSVQHVSIGDLPHRDIGDERAAVGARHGNCEGVRAGQGRPAVGRGQPWRRGRRQGDSEPALSEPSDPVAEEAGRKAMRGDHEACPVGGLGQLSLDDAREGQIPDRAVAVPALVSRLGRDPARLGAGIEIRQRAQPRDPGDPVAGTAPAIRFLEVVGKRPRVGLREAERAQLLKGVQADRSGSGFTMPTPCSRFVAAIASARAMIACETSASGSAKTIGSPSSA